MTTTYHNLNHARTFTRDLLELVTGEWADGTEFEVDPDHCVWPGVSAIIKADPGFNYLFLGVADGELFVHSTPIITWSVVNEPLHHQDIKGGTALIGGAPEWFELPLCDSQLNAYAIQTPDGLVQADGYFGTVDKWKAKVGPRIRQAYDKQWGGQNKKKQKAAA
jgi:hypothetical protein